jgi:hypothetical protein
MAIDRPPFVAKLVQSPRYGKLAAAMHDAWLCHTYPMRRLIKNRVARRAMRRSKVVLDEVQQRILDDLNSTGFAEAKFTELFDEATWNELKEAVLAWTERPEMKAAEQAYLANHEASKGKEYLVRLYADQASLTAESPFFKASVSPRVLDIVNSYLGVHSRLIYVDVWNTLANPNRAGLTGSQQWHRDPEDTRMIKTFLYFTDVNLENGAMHYVKQSRLGEKNGAYKPVRIPGGVRATDEEIANAFPKEDIHVCSHPAGTIIFCDTTGFHMGGRAVGKNRLFSTAAYVTPASLWKRRFTIKKKGVKQLSTVQADAVV